MKEPTKVTKNCDWTREKTAILISLYQSHECLWNNSIESYKNKDIRTNAIEEICDQMKLNKEDFYKKIHNLRNQFNAEMKKLEKRNDSPTEVLRSRWEHFEALLFLKDVIASRMGFSTTSKGQREFGMNDSMLYENVEHHSTSYIQETEDTEVRIKEITNTTQNKECEDQKRDIWYFFGEFVAAEFRNLNFEHSRKKLKRKFLQALLEVGEEDDRINFNISLN